MQIVFEETNVKARQAGKRDLCKQTPLVSFPLAYLSFRQRKNVFAWFTVATSPMLFSPIPTAHSLAASKTNPGSVKYTLGRPDETVGPHLGISGA